MLTFHLRIFILLALIVAKAGYSLPLHHSPRDSSSGLQSGSVALGIGIVGSLLVVVTITVAVLNRTRGSELDMFISNFFPWSSDSRAKWENEWEAWFGSNADIHDEYFLYHISDIENESESNEPRLFIKKCIIKNYENGR